MTFHIDLTQAILIGYAISAAIFINNVVNQDINLVDVDPQKKKDRGLEIKGNLPHVRVAYLTGLLFFAATNNFNQAFARRDHIHVLILSMRAVALVDI